MLTSQVYEVDTTLTHTGGMLDTLCCNHLSSERILYRL